jgi:hypothetical protein
VARDERRAATGGDGLAALRQSCKSGDVGCDTDVAPGTCTFSLAICLDRDDARLAKGTTACKRPSVERVQVVKPARAMPMRQPSSRRSPRSARRAGRRHRDLHAALDGTERCTEVVP